AASRLRHDPQLPGIVQLPARSGEITNYINPGQFSGKLGPNYEPMMVRGDLDKPMELTLPEFTLPDDVNLARLGQRHTLLARLDRWQRALEQSVDPRDRGRELIERYDAHQGKAFALLTSSKSKEAFDLSKEPEAVRERYGRDINGQSVL